MIDKTIQFLTNQLNQHLKNLYTVHDDLAVASPMLAPGGQPAPGIQNKVVLTLINIKQDALLKNEPVYKINNTSPIVGNAPLHISLTLLFAANFDNYAEALKFISATMKFFQGKSVFNQSNSPEMDSSVDSLILDLENTSIQDLKSIWGMHGDYYLPSVIYKLRMLTA
ncbi:hypothetical protein A0256_08670 [Mucilaginibacter sp. PAMC 26640]|nr:hypothetical protein A0256_08670 [Mucilaginibacter sp. PAMC 26640]